jgi:hypothetical protein
LRKHLLSIGLLTGSLFLPSANAGLVQLELNHSTSIAGQGNYTDILSDLTSTQTQSSNYGEGFGYNDFRLDIRFSDFNYFYNPSTGKLHPEGHFNINTKFSVGFDDADNQENFYQTASNAGFYKLLTQLAFTPGMPDGLLGIYDIYNTDPSVTADAGKSLGDLAAQNQPAGSHLAIDVQAAVDRNHVFDSLSFYHFLTQRSFESFFLHSYEGMNVSLFEPTQAEVDQYAAENFVSAMDWSFIFTRSSDGLDPDALSYNINAHLNIEYAASAEENVREIFYGENFTDEHLSSHGSIDGHLRAMPFVPSAFGKLDQASTAYEFVAAQSTDINAVPEPNSALLASIGLLALLWRRRTTQNR